MSEVATATWAFDHVGLSVGDLDRAIEFYERAFGFGVESRFDLPHGTKAAMLDHPSRTRLELFERPGSESTEGLDPNETLRRQGYGHWALWTDDVASMFDDLVEAGATPVWKPEKGRSVPVFAYLADPEGNLIELMQRREE